MGCKHSTFFIKFVIFLFSEGESCNHIAAVLCGLTDITEKKKEGLHASTSNTCKWNQPRKRKLSPKKSQDITFKKCKWDLEVQDSKVEKTPLKKMF